MFLYGGLLVEGMYASGLVVYDNKLSVLAVALAIFSKLSFLFGVRLVGGSYHIVDGMKRGAVVQVDQVDRLVLLFLGLASIAAGLNAAAEILNLGVFTGGFFSGGGLAEVRNEMWDEMYSDGVSASPVRSIMSVASFCLAILLPYFVLQRRLFFMALSIFSCLVIIAESFTSAGRFSLALLVICLVISFSYASGRTRLIEIIGVRVSLVLGAMMFYSLIIFPVQRNPELPQAVAAYLSWLADAEIAAWVHEIAETPGFSWFTVLAYSSSYFSGALDKLSYFVTETDIGQWYTLGLYNFPIVSQISSSLGLADYFWVDIRQMISSKMAYVGLAGNPWATGMRDFIIDFGYVGSVIAAGFLGAGCQYCCRAAVRSPRVYWKVLGVISAVAAFIMAFVSPFQIRLLSNSVIILLLFIFFRWLVRSGSSSAAVDPPRRYSL
jgi:hypothetical protein